MKPNRRERECEGREGMANIIPMRNEDLEPTHDLCQWDRMILFPFLHHRDVVDEDEEVVRVAFVEDFVDTDVSASHDYFDFLF